MKKNFKKFASLMLALVMAFALAAPAFAAESEPAAAGSVTVYVTEGMFTTGGVKEDGTAIPQEYDGERDIQKHILTSTTGWTVDGSNFTISSVERAISRNDIQSVYNPPETLPANVLDAIINALRLKGVVVKDIKGGWDAKPVSGPAGGYINSVPGAPTSYGDTKEDTVGGVKYDVYTGAGWNIAVGTSTENAEAITTYGSSVELTDGMVIIFDLSPYTIYYPAG